MTKEELEKEAIKASDKKCVKGCSKYYRYGFQDGYITGAEPREKRIVDLESTNKKISDECHKLVNTLEKKQNKNELLETQNIKLQAEVSRLTIKNAELKLKLEALEGQTPWKDIKDKSEVIGQLTNAKEIIKKYLAIGVGGKITQNYLDVTKQAEQFLKEE